jgi:hypothetical protein
MNYTDADGVTRGSGEQYANDQYERHGGFPPASHPDAAAAWAAAYEASAPAGAPPLEQLQPVDHGQQSAYEPQFYEEPDYGEEPVEFDPFSDDPEGQIRQIVREEAGLDDEQNQWLAHASEAEGNARDEAAERAAMEQGYETLGAEVDALTHGRLKGDPQIRTQVVNHVGEQYLADNEAAAAHLLNSGFPAEEIMPALQRNASALLEEAWGKVQHQRSIDDMKAQVRAHYGRS